MARGFIFTIEVPDMYYPGLEEVKRAGQEANLVPIYREIVADLDTPVSAFLKIRSSGYSFLLESVEGGERLARYSFIGTDPYRVIRVDSEDKTDPLAMVAGELGKYKLAPVEGLPKFTGGAVGYLAYETVTRFEDLPSPERDPLGLPESFFMFVDTVLIFDHVIHKIKVLSHVHLDGDIEKAYHTNGAVDAKASDFFGAAHKLELKRVIDHAAHDREIVKRIMDSLLHGIRQQKIPCCRDRLKDVAVEHFAIEPEHFLIKTLKRVLLEILTRR